MGEATASVILIDPSIQGREALRNLILGMDWVTLEAECSQYDHALDLLSQNEYDGVIITLDDDPSMALEVVATVGQQHPGVAIVAISSKPDQLIQAHRHGARSLIDQPVQLEDMIRAMNNLGAIGATRTSKAQVISVLSSRGGVGCTSIAANLACTFAAQPPKQVTLIDLDLAMGAVDIALGIEPERRLTDMATSIERMDMQLIRGSLTKHATGLYVLPRPASLTDIGLIHEDHIQRIIRLLKLLCSHLVIDLSKGWLVTDLQALSMSDIVLLIIQPELPSIRSAVMILNTLAQDGLDSKVLVVMNRAGAFFGKDSINVKTAEDVLGRLVYWQIPNDYKALMDSWNSGVPLITLAPRSKAQLSIAAMADDLTRRHHAEGAKPKKSSSTIIKLPSVRSG